MQQCTKILNVVENDKDALMLVVGKPFYHSTILLWGNS